MEGSLRPGWGEVAGRTEATLGMERAGEWSFGRWDKDLLLVRRGRGGGCCLLYFSFFKKNFSGTGGGLCGPREGRCHILKCIFSKSESGSLTGERSGGGGSGGNKSWTGLKRNNLEGS